ncbi:hypothetical protein D3C76_1294850 [compost metagenome]
MTGGVDIRQLVERPLSDNKVLAGVFVETAGRLRADTNLEHIAVTVDQQVKIPMGHGHYSGEDRPVANHRIP